MLNLWAMPLQVLQFFLREVAQQNQKNPGQIERDHNGYQLALVTQAFFSRLVVFGVSFDKVQWRFSSFDDNVKI